MGRNRTQLRKLLGQFPPAQEAVLQEPTVNSTVGCQKRPSTTRSKAGLPASHLLLHGGSRGGNIFFHPPRFPGCSGRQTDTSRLSRGKPRRCVITCHLLYTQDGQGPLSSSPQWRPPRETPRADEDQRGCWAGGSGTQEARVLGHVSVFS